MRDTSDGWRALLLVLALPGWLGAAPATVPPDPAAASPAAPAAVSAEETQARLAKGEVRYGDKWMPIAELFESYRKARAEAAAIVEKNDGFKDRMAEVTKSAAQVLAEWRKAKAPVDAEKSKALAKKQLAQRVLGAPRPQAPRLQSEPGHSSDGDVSHWQREIARVRAENARKQALYAQELRRYEEYQRQATDALRESTDTIAQCEKKSDELLAGRKDAEKPLFEERTKLTAQMQSLQPQAMAAMSRVRSMAEALGAVPEAVRLKCGILQWQNAYYSLAEIEDLYAKTKALVDGARSEAEAKMAAAGATLSKDWRHPKQDDADALKTLLDRAKAAAAAT